VNPTFIKEKITVGYTTKDHCAESAITCVRIIQVEYFMLEIFRLWLCMLLFCNLCSKHVVKDVFGGADTPTLNDSCLGVDLHSISFKISQDFTPNSRSL